MKIEVDLNDIFCDEEGNPSESLQQSVERQVVESMTRKLEKGIGKQVDEAVAAVISKKLQELADTLLPKLAEDMLNAEYTVVDNYGNRAKEPTTFKKELVKIISTKLKYEATRYDSDKNVFTKTVDNVIESNMKLFQSEYNKLVTDGFTKDALTYAVMELKKKLGIQ